MLQWLHTFSSLYTELKFVLCCMTLISSSSTAVNSNYEMGKLDPHFMPLECSGEEYRITDCQYNSSTMDFSYYEDWVVNCIVGQ